MKKYEFTDVTRQCGSVTLRRIRESERELEERLMPGLKEELRKREILAVKRLGEEIGYGNMMDIAAAIWTMKLSDDKTTRIMHVPTVESCIKKKEWERTKQEVIVRIEEIKSYGIDFEN